MRNVFNVFNISKKKKEKNEDKTSIQRKCIICFYSEQQVKRNTYLVKFFSQKPYFVVTLSYLMLKSIYENHFRFLFINTLPENS